MKCHICKQKQYLVAKIPIIIDINYFSNDGWGEEWLENITGETNLILCEYCALLIHRKFEERKCDQDTQTQKDVHIIDV